MNIPIHAIYQATYLNMISQIMKELKLPQLLDRMVPVDNQCQTRPSDVVQLILLDILSGRQALVHLEKWMEHIDHEKLIREGLSPSWLNDDAIARHLDRLHEAGIHEIVSSFLVQTYRIENLSPGVFHGDTTSKSLYGAYSRPNETIQLVEGYSRDRAGAKQFQYGLIGNRDGIPLHVDVHDGNQSDKEWNPTVIAQLHAQCDRVQLDADFIYVADSAAMTQQTLNQLDGKGFFITRGPNHLKIVKEALRLADQENAPWSNPIQFAKKDGAVYRFVETTADYYGHDVRLLVTESSALDRKKEKTLEKKREKEQELLAKQQKELETFIYHCEEDALQSAKQLEAAMNLSFHTVTAHVQSTERVKPKRGRPKKGTVPEVETIYTVQLASSFDQDAFQRERRRASRFVLITTVPPVHHEKTMDGEAILGMYKGQIHVEMNFSFLKDPFYTDELYLKKPERVRVLGYLFLLALVVYRVFQRRLRQVITAQRPLKGAGGRTLTSPTGEAIFKIFQYVQVVAFQLPDGTLHRQFGQPLTYEQQRVLRELGMDESIYL